MNFRLNKPVYLWKVLISYLVLAVTDLVHHLHAAVALGHESALHAATLGIVLIPLTITMYWFYGHYQKKAYVVIFLLIVTLAVLIPGIQHGGWHHVVKLMIEMGSSDNASTTAQVLQRDKLHIWFYEISGVFEFIMALLCGYFIIQHLRDRSRQ